MAPGVSLVGNTFGNLLAATTDYLLIGSAGHDSSYIYNFDGTLYNLLPNNIEPNVVVTGQLFGFSGTIVEPNNSTLHIAITDKKGFGGTGEVYLFDAINSVINQVDSVANNYSVSFGTAVQFSGTILVIGDPGSEGNTGKSGSIILYQNTSGVDSLVPQLVTLFISLLLYFI